MDKFNLEFNYLIEENKCKGYFEPNEILQTTFFFEELVKDLEKIINYFNDLKKDDKSIDKNNIKNTIFLIDEKRKELREYINIQMINPDFTKEEDYSEYSDENILSAYDGLCFWSMEFGNLTNDALEDNEVDYITGVDKNNNLIYEKGDALNTFSFFESCGFLMDEIQRLNLIFYKFMEMNISEVMDFDFSDILNLFQQISEHSNTIKVLSEKLSFQVIKINENTINDIFDLQKDIQKFTFYIMIGLNIIPKTEKVGLLSKVFKKNKSEEKMINLVKEKFQNLNLSQKKEFIKTLLNFDDISWKSIKKENKDNILTSFSQVILSEKPLKVKIFNENKFDKKVLAFSECIFGDKYGK